MTYYFVRLCGIVILSYKAASVEWGLVPTPAVVARRQLGVSRKGAGPNSISVLPEPATRRYPIDQRPTGT